MCCIVCYSNQIEKPDRSIDGVLVQLTAISVSIVPLQRPFLNLVPNCPSAPVRGMSGTGWDRRNSASLSEKHSLTVPTRKKVSLYENPQFFRPTSTRCHVQTPMPILRTSPTQSESNGPMSWVDRDQ